MRTVRRSCMTAGTGYGLAPFVKVQLIIGFYIINSDVPLIFCSKDKNFQKTCSIKYGICILTDTKYCVIITLLLILCAFPPSAGGQTDIISLGAKGFALHTLREPLAPSQEAEGELYSAPGFVRIVNGIAMPICGGICWRFIYKGILSYAFCGND